ncbi:MAG: 30S ribosomal protein S3 [Nitrospirae bacterium]|nr:MAG: 30S ribosomal protein S3 [Nitrospirota bacterium]
MGQKTHPVGYRLGYTRTWSSRWYAGKDYAKLLHQDIKIRKMVKEKLYHAGVSKVEIERSGDQTRVIIQRSVAAALRLGAQGIRVTCAGRLGGAEIARTEWYREGRVPLHTLRAYIDYGFAEAHTTMGQIGVKTWIYKGEVLPVQPEKPEPTFDRR